VPGTFTAVLESGNHEQHQPFAVIIDPRSAASHEDLEQQFDFLIEVRDRISGTHDAVRRILALRDALSSSRGTKAIDAALAELDDVEDRLRQKRSKVWQDTANFEPLIDDQFAWLASYAMSADARPTDSARERFADLSAVLDAELARIDAIEESLRLGESGDSP
jgi:hypothetical protein